MRGNSKRPMFSMDFSEMQADGIIRWRPVATLLRSIRQLRVYASNLGHSRYIRASNVTAKERPNMRKIFLLGAIAILSACSDKSAAPAGTTSGNEAPSLPAQDIPAPTASTPAPAPASKVLSADGIGAIRFGMKLAEAEQAAGKATLPEPFDPVCSMVRFASVPKLRFMVEEGVVTRADAEPGVGNAVGVAVGDTLAQVREKHPDAQVSTHKYDKNGHYVTFPNADGKAAIILEESGGKVSKVRAGLQPAVAYVETCG
ncbi:hypothetical protein GCM10027317_25830 [Massilia agri]